MKDEWIDSERIFSRVVLASFFCIYLWPFQAFADLAPGQAGSGTLDLGENSPTIYLTAPEGFTFILGAGNNNDTSRSASINVANYNDNVYLKVRDANAPSGGKAGYMYSDTEQDCLEKPLWIGEKDRPSSMVALSNEPKTIYTFKDAPGNAVVSLDIGQATDIHDAAASDYAITVTFTATATA
jgi:hypothetical protein